MMPAFAPNISPPLTQPTATNSNQLQPNTQPKPNPPQGIYTDLTPNWYKTVGLSIVTSQFIATAVRIANVALGWALARFRRCAAAKGSVLTQEELLAAMRGPAFELDWRYGQHLNVIFVAMLLSGGIPVAYLSAAVWFGVAYWAEKWELLKLSRRPVAYGGDLSEAVTSMLPFATVGGFWWFG
jgi:hypothetical protein